MTMARDTSADDPKLRLRAYVLQNFAFVWRMVERIPFLARRLNAYLINGAVQVTRNRPHPFGTVSDYTSWRSLTDRTYYARHLPAVEPPAGLPPLQDVVRLFHRAEGEARMCSKSTFLFPVFAQYLTDGFLRTVMDDRQRTSSNHEIDLCPLYGRTRAQSDVLRARDESKGRRGRLLSQEIDGEEYPPFLFKPDGRTVAAAFVDADGHPVLDMPLGLHPDEHDGYERQIFAVGGDRANATPQVAMMNTLLLREHNRIAAGIEADNPAWDDERVFQTARNVVIVSYIRIVVEEYINHISSALPKLRADPSVAWKAAWNRPNWMTVEFALLYRWHAMIPDTIVWNGDTVPAADMLLDNRFLTRSGLVRALTWTSAQHAGALGLFNTAPFLWPVEERSIAQARESRVASYNDYRAAMGLPRLSHFRQITGDARRQAALEKHYGTPDRLEFYVGLFAEDVNPNTPMPPLIGRMVALDAFSQALTNPLLSEHVYNAETFSRWGFAELGKRMTLADLVLRQEGSKADGWDPSAITMTRLDWRRV
jgi:prostaglandin-endoperoxide synthase 2